MRVALVLLVGLAACDSSGSDADACPMDLREGDACLFAGRCWHQDGFSSCYSGWCSCFGGRVVCDGIAPSNGLACGDEPIDSCSYEGNPDCNTPPTAQWCDCDQSGTWTCGCSCYGLSTTCAVDPCSLPPGRINGAGCSDHDDVCTYQDGTVCRCQPGPFEEWTFRCE